LRGIWIHPDVIKDLPDLRALGHIKQLELDDLVSASSFKSQHALQATPQLSLKILPRTRQINRLEAHAMPL
jgi:hypothetical protein